MQNICCKINLMKVRISRISKGVSIMKNLLFYGTTNYGENLNNSNILKFRELSKNFSMFVMTYGHENKTVNHDYVTINYIKNQTL